MAQHVSSTHEKIRLDLSNNGKSTSKFIIFDFLNFSVTCHCNTLYYLFFTFTKTEKEQVYKLASSHLFKIYHFACRILNKKKARRRAEPSTWLADFTHTCAPTCRHLAHGCRKERALSFFNIRHIYTTAELRV